MKDLNQGKSDEINNIRRLFKNVLDAYVEKYEWLSLASYNKVYKIVTLDKPYILRIFPEGGTQNINDINLLESKLSQNNIHFPKTLFCSSDDKYFPHGCSISEYIVASTAKQLLNEGLTTLVNNIPVS